MYPDLGSCVCVGIPFLALISVGIFFLVDRAQEKKREWVFRNDMVELYKELVDDSSMTPQKWREWLPYFDYSDECYRRTHGSHTDFERLADRVKEDIGDAPYRHRIGSSE